MNNFSEDIPLSSHVIDMILFNDSYFLHNFHSKKPITILIIPSFFSHLKNFPKSSLSNNSQDLKILRPNLGFCFFFFIVILFLGFVFGFSLDLEREGRRDGVTRRRTHIRMGPGVDNLRIPKESRRGRRGGR